MLLLQREYPGDPGVVTSMLLNPVTLQPGEAMLVPAGGVHAYLHGVGVEIMASSDNVLRAGLTLKHVDVPELLRNVDYVAAPPIRIAPEVFHGATKVFYAPVDDFELSVTELADDDDHPLPGRGPRILLALAGELTVATSNDGTLTLTHGQAAFVPGQPAQGLQSQDFSAFLGRGHGHHQGSVKTSSAIVPGRPTPFRAWRVGRGCAGESSHGRQDQDRSHRRGQ